MWSSGVTKLLSGDRRWRDLSAVAFHYETHLCRNACLAYAPISALVPPRFDRLRPVIELIVPFFIIIPALRPFAAVLFIILMVLIELTGNYAFFNLLGIALYALSLLMPAAHFFSLENWHPPRRLQFPSASHLSPPPP